MRCFRLGRSMVGLITGERAVDSRFRWVWKWIGRARFCGKDELDEENKQSLFQGTSSESDGLGPSNGFTATGSPSWVFPGRIRQQLGALRRVGHGSSCDRRSHTR